MARTATLPMPQNTTHAAALAPPPAAAPPDAPDFLTSQRQILRDAPDDTTAIRWQLGDALAQIATMQAQIATLQAQLWAVAHPPPRQPLPPLRPAIRALLRARALAMTAAQIQEALDATRSMVKPLNDMLRDGQLTCTDGQYALVVPGSGSLVPGSNQKPQTTNQEPSGSGSLVPGSNQQPATSNQQPAPAKRGRIKAPPG